MRIKTWQSLLISLLLLLVLAVTPILTACGGDEEETETTTTTTTTGPGPTPLQPLDLVEFILLDIVALMIGIGIAMGFERIKAMRKA